MNKGRVEAFSDGVLAIIVTIMVLELKTPESSQLLALVGEIPIFLGYIVSFIFVGVFWIYHHKLLDNVDEVNINILIYNLNWLFWTSLLPFATGWMSNYPLTGGSTLFYSLILLLSTISYHLLRASVLQTTTNDSFMNIFIGTRQIRLIILGYFLAVILSYWIPIIPFILCVLIAVSWIISDRDNLVNYQ